MFKNCNGFPLLLTQTWYEWSCGTLLSRDDNIVPLFTQTVLCFCSVLTEAEKQQAAAKDTKQLRQFEENLLHNYRLYLQMLEECIGMLCEHKQPTSNHALIATSTAY